MSDAGIDEPEQKCPATNTTLSVTILLATAVACLGSQASSPTTSSSFWPLTPPAALMSATAISAPRFICSPNTASGPVIGPAAPILICANAGTAAKATVATASVPKILLMEVSLITPPHGCGAEVKLSAAP